jgi:hypothetical protein
MGEKKYELHIIVITLYMCFCNNRKRIAAWFLMFDFPNIRVGFKQVNFPVKRQVWGPPSLAEAASWPSRAPIGDAVAWKRPAPWCPPSARRSLC